MENRTALSAAFVRKKKGGAILLLLSVIMLLVGGGFGPPTSSILAGVAGTGIGTPSAWWRERQSVKVRCLLSSVWPWVFGLAVINGVFLVIGSVILVCLFDLNNPDLFTNSFFFAILSLAATIVFARAYDVQKAAQSFL